MASLSWMKGLSPTGGMPPFLGLGRRRLFCPEEDVTGIRHVIVEDEKGKLNKVSKERRRRADRLTRSPEFGIQVKSQRQKSLAYIAHDWRNRANENGIKVTSSRVSQYADGEDHHRMSSPGFWPPNRSGAPTRSSLRRFAYPVYSDRLQRLGRQHPGFGTK